MDTRYVDDGAWELLIYRRALVVNVGAGFWHDPLLRLLLLSPTNHINRAMNG